MRILILDFHFFNFPVNVEGSVIIASKDSCEQTFDGFAEPVRDALRQARKNGIIDVRKSEDSSDRTETVHQYVFTTIVSEKDKLDGAIPVVGCMLRMSLHEWCQPGEYFPDEVKLQKIKSELKKYKPSLVHRSHFVLVDYGQKLDGSGDPMGFMYGESFIETVSDSNVKILKLDQAKKLLLDEFKEKLNIDLVVNWSV